MRKQKKPAGNPSIRKKTPAYNNSSVSQRARILRHFEKFPRLSTLQARELLGVMHPGARIMELRKRGFLIDTNWTNESDSHGVLHRIGLYIFKGLAKGGSL